MHCMVRAGWVVPQLGDEAFDTTWKAGTALPLDAAAAYASRARGERKRPSTGWASLTPTELEVVAQVHARSAPGPHEDENGWAVTRASE